VRWGGGRGRVYSSGRGGEAPRVGLGYTARREQRRRAAEFLKFLEAKRLRQKAEKSLESWRRCWRRAGAGAPSA
jgi:hypothetical protein